MRRFVILLLACCAASAAVPSAAELVRSLREAGLDPQECYRVRDFSFQREDIKIYLTDGYLIFSKPVAGEPHSALFTAEVEGGDGEAILMPPYRGERQSLALFTQSPNLDEHFNAALMIFTDRSARTLLDRMVKEGAGHKVNEMGPLLAEKWTPTVFNIEHGFETRLLTDLLAPPQETGMSFFSMSGRQLGNFDLLYDPYSREQIMAGQLAEGGGRPAYNVWTTFAARSSRKGANKPPAPWFSLSDFRINAALDLNLRMKATTRVSVHVGANPLRVFPFNIAQAMKVTAVRIDGAPAELFFEDSLRGKALSGNGDDVFLAVAPEALAAGSEHQFEFDHEGAVILSAGNAVYYVNARATWYPRSGGSFSTYDLTFRYPKHLTLVSAGNMVEDRIDGDWRVTQWRTPVPIRMAGFNLGEYEKVSGSVPGYNVEVYGNRHLEMALQPKTAEPEPPLSKTQPMKMPRRPRSNTVAPLPEVNVPPDPLARLRTVAADVSSAFAFYTASFGPPALKTLTVAPIPGTFGQGFPGLVYLSTLSYIPSNELPPALRDPKRQLFFSDLIEAHEVAHQWWGNVVAADSYQDDWLLEALANYSALLWIEKKKGTKALQGVLEGYREELLAKNAQGRTIESAGPIVWGTRLDSKTFPDSRRVITYEKGAWILHMLRRRMGDERFLQMLAELRHRYEFRTISTQDFRALIKEFRPLRTTEASVDDFFDNWIYSAGVPSLKLQYGVKGAAPAVKLSGTVAQSGVDDDFSVEIPVEIQFANGPSQTVWVHTSNDPATFSVTLRRAPLHVIVPSSGVLTAKRPDSNPKSTAQN